MALKFTVLLIFVAASAVFANPAFPFAVEQQFSEEQQIPYSQFSAEQQEPYNQFADEQQRPYNQFSAEQQGPYNQFAAEQQGPYNQFAAEQQGPYNQFVEEQQFAEEQQQYWSQYVNKYTIAQEIAKAEQQALCHPITVFFVSVKICQQTPTQCGSVSVKVAHWADVDVQICRKGWNFLL